MRLRAAPVSSTTRNGTPPTCATTTQLKPERTTRASGGNSGTTQLRSTGGATDAALVWALASFAESSVRSLAFPATRHGSTGLSRGDTLRDWGEWEDANPAVAHRRRELRRFLKEADPAKQPQNDAPAAPQTTSGFDALKGMGTVGVGEEHPVYTQKLDAQGRAYSTGKRKNAIARVWIKPGSGKITINGKDQLQYFAREILRMMIAQPLEVTDRLTQFDVDCTVQGSGLSGQAGAIRHGLSHALTHYEPALRPVLKPHGFLTRDSRVVERKKYGRAKARKSFQFSKR